MARDEPSFIVAPGECEELGAQFLERRLHDELDVTKVVKIAHAIRVGIARETVAAYLGVTLEQVDMTAAIDQRYRKEEDDWAAWIEANTPK